MDRTRHAKAIGNQVLEHLRDPPRLISIGDRLEDQIADDKGRALTTRKPNRFAARVERTKHFRVRRLTHMFAIHGRRRCTCARGRRVSGR